MIMHMDKKPDMVHFSSFGDGFDYDPVADVALSDFQEARPDFLTESSWRACLHALRADGLLPEREDAKSGYILISADTPMIGLPLQPAYAPETEGGQDAASWFAAYQCEKTQYAMQEAADLDFADAAQDIDDLSGPDVPMACRVYPDGRVDLLDFSNEDPTFDVIETYSVEDMYRRAFGMDVPEPPSSELSTPNDMF